MYPLPMGVACGSAVLLGAVLVSFARFYILPLYYHVFISFIRPVVSVNNFLSIRFIQTSFDVSLQCVPPREGVFACNQDKT